MPVAVVPITPLVVALLVSVAVGAATGILAWRERPKPGATPLVALLVGQTLWSVCIIFRIQAEHIQTKEFWMAIAWIGVGLVPVGWVLFALEYTGRDQYVRPRYVAALCVIPLVTELLVLTSGLHGLIDVTYVPTGTGFINFQYSGVWYWVAAVYTYILGSIGVIALLELITSQAMAFRGQGAALLVGLAVPWGTNILFVTGQLPFTGIDPTPIAFSISGVAYLGAITRFRLLGTSPAPRKRGRRKFFDELPAGAVVLDTNDNVVDVNAYGARLLGRDEDDLIGTAGADVLPEYDRLPRDGQLAGYVTFDADDKECPHDVHVCGVENVRGDPIGRIVTFHDVSEHVRQQQRLAVLNRALRHNIRNETNVVSGFVDRLAADAGTDPDDIAVVKERIRRIEELGEKGRQAIDVFDAATSSTHPRSLDALLTDHVTEARATHPTADVTYDGPASDATVPAALDAVFENLIENAITHNTDTAHVEIAAAVADDHVTVTVTDDGPGIEPGELAVIDQGVETALEHGSGLGLWVVKWGVDVAGGTIDFAENDPHGTVVTVTVPR